MGLWLVNSKNPSLADLGLLIENVKDFGLGWDLLSFDYVKFDVNGSAKIVANIANDEEGLWIGHQILCYCIEGVRHFLVAAKKI